MLSMRKIAVIMPFYGKPHLAPSDRPDNIWDVTIKRCKDYKIKLQGRLKELYCEAKRRVEQIQKRLEEQKIRAVETYEGEALRETIEFEGRTFPLLNIINRLARVVHTRIIEERIIKHASPILYLMLPEDPIMFLAQINISDILGLHDIQTAVPLGAFDMACESLSIAFRAIHKGDAVRLILASLTKAQGLLSYNDVILHIDGTGISLRSIENGLNVFQRREDIAAFLGRRTHGWMISSDRQLIELYENYVISKALGLDYLLPDLQCGFWILRGSTAGRLNLIAHRFEIELDIAIELLRREVRFTYVDVIPEDDNGVNKWEQDSSSNEWYKWRPYHIDKLSLIEAKLKLRNICKGIYSMLLSAFKDFVKNHQDDLKSTIGVQIPKNWETVLNKYEEHVVKYIQRGAKGCEDERKSVKYPKIVSDDYRRWLNEQLKDSSIPIREDP